MRGLEICSSLRQKPPLAAATKRATSVGSPAIVICPFCCRNSALLQATIACNEACNNLSSETLISWP
ncbi:Uncharacterised protein [Legionella pneumophila]|nr:Uncharacterised protein [Legionella pneumophila]